MGIADSSLRTDGPYAYRGLDECLGLMDGFVELVARIHVIRQVGHSDPRTTWLYDRRKRQVTRNIVERISI